MNRGISIPCVTKCTLKYTNSEKYYKELVITPKRSLKYQMNLKNVRGHNSSVLYEFIFVQWLWRLFGQTLVKAAL